MGWGRWLAGRAVAGHSGATWGQAHEKKKTPNTKKGGKLKTDAKKTQIWPKLRTQTQKKDTKKHKKRRKETQKNSNFAKIENPNAKKKQEKKTQKNAFAPSPAPISQISGRVGSDPKPPKNPKSNRCISSTVSDSLTLKKSR